MISNRLITDNKGLVVSIAKRYQNRGLDFDDLLQEGYIGLMEAYKRYDKDRGTKFSTYATYWVKKAITKAIDNTGSLIRIPADNSTRLYQTDTMQDITSYNDNVDFNNLVNKIKGILTDTVEYDLFIDYVLKDLSYRDLASKYNICPEKARYTLKRLLAKVQKQLTK